MVQITNVEKHSYAAKAGIKADDVLLAINGNEINDVLDYRFYLTEEAVELSLSRKEKTFSVTIEKEMYDDIGLDFETPLMDKKHCCRNKCIFCFIDQLPKGMRETLYFKDDDARLSFLHGNYITLTNLTDCDIDRIIKMRFSPINISIHTTNPELRVEMMHNKRAGEVLSYLDRLNEAGIKMHGQVVLCRGVNDGAELDRTMRDLAKYFPNLESMSVVPVGLTDYRDGLYPLEPFTAEDCAHVIEQIDRFAKEHKQKHGSRLFFAADEFYIKAGIPLPDENYYEDYKQIENGVGMIRSHKEEFDFELSEMKKYGEAPEGEMSVSVVTGVAAYDYIKGLCDTLESEFENLKINVFKIVNNYFGQKITVAGLLTGHDIYEQLKGKELGDRLVISSNALRHEKDLFLCGMSVTELEEKLGVKVAIAENSGCDFISAIIGRE